MEIKPYIKNGKTYYKFTLYAGVVDGKRKYVKRANFKTKADARAAILSLQEEINRPVGEMTFQELTEKWLKSYETKTNRQHDQRLLRQARIKRVHAKSGGNWGHSQNSPLPSTGFYRYSQRRTSCAS